MSSNTNNLREILDFLFMKYAVRADALEEFAESKEKAIAAVLALLPEKRGIRTDMPMEGSYSNGVKVGFDKAIDQTRRNLIGEQQ
jgi:hypothetical protein